MELHGTFAEGATYIRLGGHALITRSARILVFTHVRACDTDIVGGLEPTDIT